MRKKILILLGISVLMASPDIEAEDTGVVELEPITVTASRTERRLSEVSSSVSIITEREIKDSDAKSIPDLLKNLEGIYAYDASGVGTAGRMNMRGFWGGMSTHDLLLIDGVPQNKGKDKLVDWDLIPLDNIERVEIVRGPASALYGDNAMSGVINIITKKPSHRPQTRISASCGSFDTQNYGISTSGLYKKIGYYLGGGAKSTDGFRRHCDYDNFHMGGKLDFLIDKTQNLTFSLNFRESERGAYPWAITEAQIDSDRRQARPGTENDTEKARKIDSSASYHKEISHIATAECAFYYRYEDSKSFYTSTTTGRTTKEQLGGEDTCGLIPRLIVNPEIFGVQHSFTMGADLERNYFDYEEYAAPFQVRGDISQDYRVTRDKIGPYLQDEIELFDFLKLIPGIRHDSVKFDFCDRKAETNSKKRKMSKITPRLGAVYTYGKESNLYANYAQAYRTPTIGQMFTYGSSSNPDLSPEEAESYEAGIRHRFSDWIKANVSLYRIMLDNEIWYDYSARRYDNYGKTSHEGVETTLDYKIIKGLSGFANYTYTRAKNKSGTDKGKYLTNIPMHKGSLGLTFETNYGLRANVVVTRMGSSYIDSANDDKLSAYTAVDTKISYEYRWLTAFLAVDNLLGKEYYSYGYKSGRTKYFNPAPGRTFTFGMEAGF